MKYQYKRPFSTQIGLQQENCTLGIMKPKILVVIIGLTICLGAFLQMQYGIFTRYNYFTSQWDKGQGDIRLLIYGKQLVTIKQREIIAKRLGFQLKTIAGCMENSSEANGADCYNQVMINYLTQKLGKTWEDKFEHSADSLFRTQSNARVCGAVMNNDRAKELISTYDPRKLSHIYVRNVDLTDTTLNHPNVELIMEYRSKGYILGYFRVDPYTLRVVQIMY